MIEPIFINRSHAPLSGIQHARATNCAVVAHSYLHAFSLVSIEEDKLSIGESILLSDSFVTPWHRINFPIEFNNGLLRNKAFSCSFSQTGDLLAVVSSDTGLTIYDCVHGTSQRSLGEPGQYGSVFYLPSLGHVLVSGETRHQNGSLQTNGFIIDGSTMLRIAQSPILGTSVSIAPKLGIMLFAKDVQGATVITVANCFPPYDQYQIQLLIYTRPDAIRVSPDSKMLAILEIDRTVKIEIVDIIECRVVSRLELPGIESRPLPLLNMEMFSFHPSSRWVYLTCSFGDIAEIDIFAGCVSNRWKAHDTYLAGLTSSRCGRYLISASSSGELAMWLMPHPGTQSLQSDLPRYLNWLGNPVSLSSRLTEWQEIDLGG